MNFFKTFLFLSVFCASTPLYAEYLNDRMGYAGAQIGAGFSNNSGGTAFTFGATGGYRFLPQLIGGLFINYMNLGTVTSPSLSINGSSHTLLYFGAEGNYPLSPLEGLHVGAKVGLASVYVSASLPGTFVGDQRTTQFIFGPKLGYDYLFPGIPISVGAEANFLIKTTSGEPITGYSTIYGVSTIFNLLGVAKIWF